MVLRVNFCTDAAGTPAWLNGEFGIDDEPALIEALRRDPRVIGSDDQIIDTL